MPNAIIGPSIILESELTTYYIQFTPGANYTWSVSSGGTIVSTQGLNSIVIQWGSTGNEQITLAEDIQGTITNYSFPVTINIAPSIVGPDQVKNNTITGYSVPSTINGSFIWSVSSGGTILSEQGKNNIVISWDSPAVGMESVSVVINSGPAVTLDVFRDHSVISGSSISCSGDVNTYSVPFNASANYQWYIENGTFISGDQANSVAVSWYNPGFGSLLCVDGSTGESFSLMVFLDPKVINGPLQVNPNEIAYYNVSFLPGTVLNWEIFGNGTLLSPENENVLVSVWEVPGQYLLQLTDINGVVYFYPVLVETNLIEGATQRLLNAISAYYIPEDTNNTSTWTILQNGTILSQSADNLQAIQWDNSGYGIIEILKSNAELFHKITLNENALISGPTDVYAYDVFNYYVQDTDDTLIWRAYGGRIIEQQGNTIRVAWDGQGTGVITIKDDNGGIRILPVSIETPIIEGSTATLENETLEYTDTIGLGSTYNWNLIKEDGTSSSLTTGAASVSVNWQTAGKYRVEGIDDLTGKLISIPVIVGVIPTPVISGSILSCGNGAQINYSTPYTNGNIYIWEIDGGIVHSQDQNSITIEWTNWGDDNKVIVTEIVNGGQVTEEIDVVVKMQPDPQIIGSIVTSADSTVTYYTQDGNNQYFWEVTGGTIVSGQGENQISVLWNPVLQLTTGVVKVTESNNVCSPASDIDEINVIIKAIPDPVINGDNEILEGTNSTYSVYDSGNDLSWAVKGGIITSGQGTNQIIVAWNNVNEKSIGKVTVTESNTVSDPASVTTSFEVTIFKNPVPEVIGLELVSADEEYEYSTNASGNYFQWNINGGQFLTSPSLHTVRVKWDSTPQEILGYIEVLETISGISAANDTDRLDVTIKAIPNPSFTITVGVCEEELATYTAIDSGNDFNWEIKGGIIDSGQGTNEVVVIWDNTIERKEGYLMLTESNTVSSPGSVKYVKELFIMPQPNPTVRGINSAVSDSICAFSTQDTGNTMSWSVQDGDIIAGQGTNSIAVKWHNVTSNYVTRTISVTESNNSCNNSITANLGVDVYADVRTNFTTQMLALSQFRNARDSMEQLVYTKNEKLTLLNSILDKINREGATPATSIRYDVYSVEKATLENDLTELENVKTHNASKIDTLRTLISGSGISNLIPNLNDNLPVLLFPIRIETKFKKIVQGSTYSWRLQTRLYPDSIEIETHEKALTPDEIEAGKNYWREVWETYNGGGSSEDEERAETWAKLTLRYEPIRAAWIAKSLTPTNLTANTSGILPVFPIPDKRHTSWTKQPEVNTMPDQFVIIVYHKLADNDPYTEIAQVAGALIDDKLKMGIDPHNADSISVNNDTLEFGAGTKWMVDYTEALNNGMGIQVDLTQTLGNSAIESGTFKVVALGVKYTADELKGKEILENLINSHHHTGSGIEFLKINSSTSNTAERSSDFSNEESLTESYYTEMSGPIFNEVSSHWEKTDGQRFAEALGIDLSVVQNLRNAGKKEIQDAMRVNNALWPATFGYFLGDLWNEVVSQDNLKKARTYFTEHITARGTLPSLRIQKQVYGILPVSAYSDWQWQTNETDYSFLTDLTSIANTAYTTWKLKSKNVVHAAQPDTQNTNKNQKFFDIISLQPVSIDYYHRFAVGLDLLWNQLSLTNPSATSNWYNDKLSEIEDLWNEMGLTNNNISTSSTPSDYPKALRLNFYKNLRGKMINGLIQDGDLSFTDPLSSLGSSSTNYIAWLQSQNFQNIKDNNFGISGATTPRNLLYLLLRHSMMLEYWRAAMKIYTNGGGTPLPKGWIDAELINYTTIPSSTVNYEAGVGKWEVLDNTSILSGTKISLYLDGSTGRNSAEGAELKNLVQDLDYLKTLPSASLDLLTREHLDLCSYRLDAWQTGMANMRLKKSRDQQQTRPGTYFGAYGWVENLKVKAQRQYKASGVAEGISDPVEDTGDRLGLIHAPSLNHAVAASLLKSGYSSVKDRAWGNDWGYPRRISLSSERVKKALSILQGIRNGQEIGILLGYEFERNIRSKSGGNNLEEVDELITYLQNRYPAKAVTEPELNANASEQQGFAVVNGYSLYMEIMQTPNAIQNIPIPTTISAVTDAFTYAMTELAESVDSLSDLSMAEAAYQLIQNKHEAGTSIMEAVQKGGNIPNEIEVVTNPESGAMLTNSFILNLNDSASPENWATQLTSRAKAEPALNNWIGSVLGNGNNIAFSVQYLNATSQTPTVVPPIHINMLQLGLQPIDLVYMAEEEFINNAAPIPTLIKYYVRKQYELASETEIHIDFSDKGLTAELSLNDILPLLKQLRKLIGKAQHLSPEDFIFQQEFYRKVSDGGFDINELITRLYNSYKDLKGLNDIILNYKDIVSISSLDEDFDRLRSLLLQASEFGYIGLIPTTSIEYDETARIELTGKADTFLASIESILIEMQVFFNNINTALTSSTANELISQLQEISGKIFNGYNKVLPRFKYYNPEELANAFAESNNILPSGDPLVVEEWVQGLSKVRTNIDIIDKINVLSDTFVGYTPSLKPIQLPYKPNDLWYAVPHNPPLDMTDDKLSVLMEISNPGTFSFDGWHTGLKIDEWVEVIPSKSQTTGIAYNYDKPVAKAPNCLLLAVSPMVANSGQTSQWTWNNLIKIVNNALEMAKTRAVDPELVGDSAYGHVARAVITAYQPDDATITSKVENAFTVPQPQS